MPAEHAKPTAPGGASALRSAPSATVAAPTHIVAATARAMTSRSDQLQPVFDDIAVSCDDKGNACATEACGAKPISRSWYEFAAILGREARP